jgi:hypothetical protein
MQADQDGKLYLQGSFNEGGAKTIICKYDELTISWWKYFNHYSYDLSLAVVPDGSKIFFGVTDPAIIYLDGATGSPIGRLVISGLTGTILLSPTSSNNAILTSYYEVSIYKFANGQLGQLELLIDSMTIILEFHKAFYLSMKIECFQRATY